MAADHNQAPPEGPVAGVTRPATSARSSVPAALRSFLQERCWEHLGLERDASGLQTLTRWLEEAAREQIADAPRDRAEAETRNLAAVGWAMARSAAFRQESRGAHFRTDFPRTDEDRFRGHTLLDQDGVRLADVEEPLTVSA